jgi:hypothetical protein
MVTLSTMVWLFCMALYIFARIWRHYRPLPPIVRLCGTCTFNVGGGCRRYPPQRVYAPDPTQDVTVFPVVANANSWWCGEWKEKVEA